MTTTDFLGLYDAKVMEYLLAVAYLLMFVPMWRFVHGGALAEAREAAPARAAAPALRPAVTSLGWFHAPEGVALHPGHAWARVEDDGTVTVGLDELAQRLVDPSRLVLPRAGDRVLQGEPAFAVGDAAATVPMLAPVGGEVVAVNGAALEQPGLLHDPYGAGWLFKVKVPDLAVQARKLLSGERAREYLERAAEALALRMEPQLGYALQDGGTPVQGIARVIAGDGWADVARHHFHTEGRTP